MHARCCRTRVQRRPVHGVLLLDKPLGLSSNQALQKAKWLLRAEKAGHTGTLDPLGHRRAAAVFWRGHQIQPDAAGRRQNLRTIVLRAGHPRPAPPTPKVRSCNARDVELHGDSSAWCEVHEPFTGPIRQVPPMHSALKKDGKALV